MYFRFGSALSIMLLALSAQANTYRTGNVEISHPHARPTVAQQANGAAYLTLENRGKAADRLLGASTPRARAVEIHSMSMDGHVMKMREVEHLVLKPASKIEMKSGNGYHLMLVGLSQPLKPGDKLPVTLVFERAGKVEIIVPVEGKAAPAAAASPHQDGHHGHHR